MDRTLLQPRISPLEDVLLNRRFPYQSSGQKKLFNGERINARRCLFGYMSHQQRGGPPVMHASDR